VAKVQIDEEALRRAVQVRFDDLNNAINARLRSANSVEDMEGVIRQELSRRDMTLPDSEVRRLARSVAQKKETIG
jgi:hypothetical protein